MELIILGSGTCVPSLKRGGPGLLIKVGHKFLLFDIGLGTLHKLLSLDIKHNDIDKIYLSHFHPDHTVELISFLFACNWSGVPRENPLDVVGCGVRDFYENLNLAYYEHLTPKNYTLNLVESIDCKCAEYAITAKPMKHKKESVGYRIEDNKGKSIVYSGDTDYCDEIIELATECDVLILESSFPDDLKTDGHLTPSLAAKIAKLSNCKKLILTHIYPESDKIDLKYQASLYFDKEIIVAKDLFMLEVT